MSEARGAARAYLDYAGFAPIDPRALAVMRPFLEGGVGNASARHALGTEARTAIAAARGKVARLLGARADGLVFTATATEANNLAIKGITGRRPGRHVVTSAIEHVSIVNCCRDLEKRGLAVSYVPVDREGAIDPRDVATAIRPDTALVSVAAASGEIGTIQRTAEIAGLARARGVPVHVDAVNAAGWIPLDVDDLGVDAVTISSNDVYGPPGAAALWVRPGLALAPMILGAGQEGGYRSGTENVAAVVGLGVAADLVRSERAADARRVAELRDRLLAGLLTAVSDARLTGAPGTRRLPHHASLVVRGVKADAVLMALDLAGVAASAGSACGALTGEPSHVLRAIGCGRDEAEGSLCFTLGRWTTDANIESVLELLPAIVGRLRRLAPR